MTRASRRLHVDEGGQISALGVLAAAVFACLLLLVINTGYATSGKIQMQNAADATALSGATWMARGLNIISLNNVTQTQLLAIILVLRGLDDSFTPALAMLQYVELPACLASVFGAPFCAPILESQIYTLTIVQQIVHPLRVSLAGDDGPLWLSMKLLSGVSTVVARTFPVVGELEAIRIARQNGADVGILVPARWTVDGWPSLPVHKGSLQPDLCDPMRNGSPSYGSRGYAPLLGYPLGQGPLGRYTHFIDIPLYFWVNSLIHLFFHRFETMHYLEVCGGSAIVPSEQPVSSLAECQARGGGTAIWQEVVYETVTFSTPQPGIAISSPGDPRLAGPPQVMTLPPTSCDWTPPATPEGGGKYRRVDTEVHVVGQDDNGQPIYSYRYHFYEYDFMAASVSGPGGGSLMTAVASSNEGDPYPLLLGGDRNSTKEQARRELRYLAVAYRSRPVAVAPDFFVSPYGSHRLTYGQARVYNPTAFDTFTQDWRVTLDRTSMIEDGTLVSGLFNLNLAGYIPADTSPGVFGRITGFFGELSAAVLGFLNNH